MIKGNTRYVKKAAVSNLMNNLLKKRCKEQVGGEIFTNKLFEILDRHAPLKTFQTRSNIAPWLFEETKMLMQDRDRTQIWASSSKQKED